jgi:hypothetical protein
MAKASVAEPAGDKGESVAGYFRSLFLKEPKLLKSKSNDKLFQYWLADHPDHKEVPENVKQGLSNIKSQMRKKRGKRGRPRKEEVAAAVTVVVARPRVSRASLDELEERIDECLSSAKGLGREDLEKVILQLRLARNALVLMGSR